MSAVATVVRRPPSGTREWAASNVNIQDGCEHDCRYCYAKTMAIRFKRVTAVSWREPRLRARDAGRGFGRRVGRIMFPTAHDITLGNIDACVRVLVRMLSSGNEVLIVSKPRVACVARLCRELRAFRSQVVFRFSIGSSHDEVLSFWEPGAPGYEERLNALRLAYAEEYETSVSCEPMLDASPETIIDALRPYVTDAIWLGKINRLRNILPLNCPGDPDALRRGAELVRSQNDTVIRALYDRYRGDRLIRWKDSIKAVVGIARPSTAGMDV